MYISPHIEIVPEPRPLAEMTGVYPGIPDGESPYVAGTESRNDPPSGAGESGEPGGFAEILADLLREAEAGGAALNGEVGFEALDRIDQALPADPAGDDAAAIAGTKRKKNPLMGKPETGDETRGADKTAPAEKENAETDFPAEELQVFMGVELLINRSAEQIPPEGEAALAEADIALSGEAGFEPMAAETISAAADAAAEAPPHEAEAPDAENLSAAAELAAATGPAAEKPEPAAGHKDRPEQENRGSGRREEIRSRRRERASLEVRDFRASNSPSVEGGLKNGDLPVSAGVRGSGDAGSREITLELRLPNQGQNAPNAETAWDLKAGRAFEDLLARELHQNFNNDIVRHASMVLRDEGAGTIRLALKPETLGNVKIRLEMAENKITGHIVVESEEALRAFEREIHSLEQAFKESGFETANLEMSLAADSGAADQNRRDTDAAPVPGTIMAASRYDAALGWAETPAAVLDLFQRGPAAVNLLA
jgi:flagellar hook-length control protein FliK